MLVETLAEFSKCLSQENNNNNSCSNTSESKRTSSQQKVKYSHLKTKESLNLKERSVEARSAEDAGTPVGPFAVCHVLRFFFRQ